MTSPGTWPENTQNNCISRELHSHCHCGLRIRRNASINTPVSLFASAFLEPVQLD